MNLDGARADIQLGADVGTGESLRHHLQNLPLSIGQCLVYLSVGLISFVQISFDSGLSKRGRQIARAEMNIADSLCKLIDAATFQDITTRAVFESVQYILLVRMHR